MKTTIMLGAVALLTGITIANAQMTRAPDDNKANATQLNSQAADPNTNNTSAAPGGSQQMAKGNGAFCITMSASNSSLNCKFASMAACEKEAKTQNLQCSPNPKRSTTGSKM